MKDISGKSLFFHFIYSFNFRIYLSYAYLTCYLFVIYFIVHIFLYGHHRNHYEEQMAMGWSRDAQDGRQMDQENHRLVPTTRLKKARRPPRRWDQELVAHYGQSWRRHATDRQQWTNLGEGFFQQWSD